MIQSPISYYGSKTTIAPWLIRHFPAHSIYLEPFCGSARLLLAKAPSPVEVISDLDPYVINFWQQVQSNWHLLKFRCLYDFNRKFFLIACNDLWPSDRLEAARRFYARIKCSYRHLQHSRTFDPLKRSSFFTGLDALEAASGRVRHVRIARSAYETQLLLHDKDETLAYLDPPYHPDTLQHENPYRIRFDRDKHEELLALIRSLKKLKVMLSGYDHPSYRAALRNWNMKRKRTRIIVGNGSNDARRWECIWMNY